MAKARTWLFIILGLVGLLFVGCAGVFGLGVYFFTKHISTTHATSASAAETFQRRAPFRNQAPLIRADVSRARVRRVPDRGPPDVGRQTDPTARPRVSARRGPIGPGQPALLDSETGPAQDAIRLAGGQPRSPAHEPRRGGTRAHRPEADPRCHEAGWIAGLVCGHSNRVIWQSGNLVIGIDKSGNRVIDRAESAERSAIYAAARDRFPYRSIG